MTNAEWEELIGDIKGLNKELEYKQLNRRYIRVRVENDNDWEFTTIKTENGYRIAVF